MTLRSFLTDFAEVLCDSVDPALQSLTAKCVLSFNMCTFSQAVNCSHMWAPLHQLSFSSMTAQIPLHARSLYRPSFSLGPHAPGPPSGRKTHAQQQNLVVCFHKLSTVLLGMLASCFETGGNTTSKGSTVLLLSLCTCKMSNISEKLLCSFGREHSFPHHPYVKAFMA